MIMQPPRSEDKSSAHLLEVIIERLSIDPSVIQQNNHILETLKIETNKYVTDNIIGKNPIVVHYIQNQAAAILGNLDIAPDTEIPDLLADLKQLVIEIDKAYSYEQLIIEELKINMKKYGKEGNIVITTVDGNKIITATNRKKTPSTVVYSTGQGTRFLEKMITELGGTSEVIDDISTYTVTITLPLLNKSSDN